MGNNNIEKVPVILTKENYKKLLDIGYSMGEFDLSDDNIINTALGVLLQKDEMNLASNIENLVYCLTNNHKEEAKKKFKIV